MSKAREAFYVIMERLYPSIIKSNYTNEEEIINELVDRDEPKPVLHENVMKQFGKCPECNSSVAIQFHSDFCGKCGCRLKWRGEEK